VTWSPDFHRAVWDDPLWAGIEAVREERVFLAPSVPFGWIDRPPSINRMMGLKWMAAKLWPERWEGDLRAEVAAFYRLYYQVELTGDKLDTLMRWQAGNPPR
jgi:iron complex transport system substrate-binding protein